MLTMSDYDPANLGPALVHVFMNLFKLLVGKGVITHEEAISLFSKSAEEHESLDAEGVSLSVNRQAAEMLRLCEAYMRNSASSM